MDAMSAAFAASQAEKPLSENVNSQGPGGQAYDLAPSPRLRAHEDPKGGLGIISRYPYYTALVGVALGAGLFFCLRRYLRE